MTPIQLETRIQELFDGVLAEDHWAELSQELSNSNDARKLYCDYSRMHTLLRQRSRGIESLISPVPIIPIDDIIKNRRKKSFQYASMAAAAILIIALVTMRLFFVAEKQPSLTFETAPGTQFALTHGGNGDAPEGLVLEKGSRLQLSQGTVELTFESGVKSIIMAPADLTLHDDDVLFLNKGTAWFQVPAQAAGFTVKTTDLDIVDLGTEFGVLAKPNDHDEVHVIKGKVQVSAKRLRQESTTLVAGEARRIDPVGRLTVIPTEKTAFLTSLPKSLLYLHWSFNSHSDSHLTCEGSHPLSHQIESTLVQADDFNPNQRFTTGQVGKALHFNGEGQTVITNWEGISGDAPRTVAFWVQLPTDKKPGYDSGSIAWGTRYPGQETRNTKWNIQFCRKRSGDSKKSIINCSMGGLWLEGTTPVNDGKWHHVCVTYSGTNGYDGKPDIQIYLDGRPETTGWVFNRPLDTLPDGKSKVDTLTQHSYAHPFTLGRSLHPAPKKPSYFQGDLDELYVFFGHLSAQEVKQLFAQPNSR